MLSFQDWVAPAFTEVSVSDHGRIETRRISCSASRKNYLKFPHVGQVFLIGREVVDTVLAWITGLRNPLCSAGGWPGNSRGWIRARRRADSCADKPLQFFSVHVVVDEVMILVR